MPNYNPSSPQSAALYYWGGHCNSDNSSNDGDETKATRIVHRNKSHKSRNTNDADDDWQTTNTRTTENKHATKRRSSRSVRHHAATSSWWSWDDKRDDKHEEASNQQEQDLSEEEDNHLADRRRRPAVPWRRRRDEPPRRHRRCDHPNVRLQFHLEDDEDVENHWLTRLKQLPGVSKSSSFGDDGNDSGIPAAVEISESEDSGNDSDLSEDEDEDDVNVMEEETVPKVPSTVQSQVKTNDYGDFDEIPVVDMSLPPAEYARAVGHACRTAGFFYVVGHGVPPNVVERLWTKSKDLFDMSPEDKAAIMQDANGGRRGYFGLGAEDLENKDGTRDLDAEERNGGVEEKQAKARTGDYKEGFDCGRDILLDNVDNCNDKDRACLEFFGKNKWPSEKSRSGTEGFRSAVLDYQDRVLALADRLLVAFAVSLNENNGDSMVKPEVPSDYFLVRSRKPMCTLRLLHYPPTTTQQGCGAHTDYGLFTILRQDETIGGLQVRNRSMEWIDAPPFKDSFVVNVGDMMSRWTDGEYSSTVHRVKSPDVTSDLLGGVVRRSRYSVPFFFNPDYDAVVESIVSNKGEEEDETRAHTSKKTTALEILASRYEGTFAKP